MKAAFLNPNLIVQRNDRFTTGVIYMPIGLAYVAGATSNEGIAVQLIDSFGEAIRRVRLDKKFMYVGTPEKEVAARIDAEVDIVFVYANQVINHLSVLSLIKETKNLLPEVPVVVLENTQAVTAYAINVVAEELFEAGADFLLTGEAEITAPELVKVVAAGGLTRELFSVKGLQFAGNESLATPVRILTGREARQERDNRYIQNLDKLPLPAWHFFPLDNYWSLGFAHGPLSSKSYLPLLTSRGCPYPCKFCVVPATNEKTWRARSPSNVVDEIEHWVNTLGVKEFHLEDLNPTIKDVRIREICEEILDRGLDVTWKIVAGTKVESIRDEQTIDLMADSGCKYISISPESGSSEVMKLIDKPFKMNHAVRIVKQMNIRGIFSQACFVLGFPGETDADRELTWSMVKSLTKEGVDEVALFMVSPVPGSEIYDEFEGYSSLSDLNFTPTWREDYRTLNRFRLRLYLAFLLWKVRYHPWKVVLQAVGFCRLRFNTKMEMVPFKALVWKWTELVSSRSK